MPATDFQFVVDVIEQHHTMAIAIFFQPNQILIWDQSIAMDAGKQVIEFLFQWLEKYAERESYSIADSDK